jgi:uncharacterized protein (DUF927 family)
MSVSEIELPGGETVQVTDVGGYRVKPDGIYDAKDETTRYSSLCWVDANITILDDDAVLKVIKGLNVTTGALFELHLPNSDFISDYRNTLIHRVCDKGCEIEFGKQKDLMAYLAKQKPTKHIMAVRQIGWHTGLDGKTVYVRPDLTVGVTSPPIVLLSSETSVAHQAIFRSCSLEEEQLNVSNYCSGNPVLIFAMGIAFASLMMRLLDIEGGGFHFYGHSSRGKTTILQMIAFVLGDGSDPGRSSNYSYIQSWDSTNFGIELMAKSFNDTAFLLDELHKYNDTKLASLVYSIAGGKGKSRGRADLKLRRSNQWMNFVGSTGEHSIPAAIAKMDPRKVTTGQQIRIQNILVEDEIFLNTHDMETRAFIEMLKSNCAKYHGASGEIFIEHLVAVANDEKLIALLRNRHQAIANALTSNAMTVEQARVTPRFAAIQLGLNMSIELGLINISFDEANNAVTSVLSSWLDNVSLLSDIDQGIANIRTFIRTQPRRFRDANDPGDLTTNFVGYKDCSKNLYFIIPEKIEEVCGKSHTREILRELQSTGLLRVNNKNANGSYKLVSKQRILGKSTGVYAIEGKILELDESECEGETILFDENAKNM